MEFRSQYSSPLKKKLDYPLTKVAFSLTTKLKKVLSKTFQVKFILEVSEEEGLKIKDPFFIILKYSKAIWYPMFLKSGSLKNFLL